MISNLIIERNNQQDFHSIKKKEKKAVLSVADHKVFLRLVWYLDLKHAVWARKPVKVVLRNWLRQQGMWSMQIHWDSVLTQLSKWELLWNVSKASQQARGAATFTSEDLLLDGNLKSIPHIWVFLHDKVQACNQCHDKGLNLDLQWGLSTALCRNLTAKYTLKLAQKVPVLSQESHTGRCLCASPVRRLKRGKTEVRKVGEQLHFLCWKF